MSMRISELELRVLVRTTVSGRIHVLGHSLYSRLKTCKRSSVVIHRRESTALRIAVTCGEEEENGIRKDT